MAAGLKKIQQALDEVRPFIQMHNGDIEFVEFKDNIVYIRFLGACVGCPISTYTLKMGVEQRLKEKIPSIRSVEAVD